jgi:hypothetical protein
MMCPESGDRYERLANVFLQRLRSFAGLNRAANPSECAQIDPGSSRAASSGMSIRVDSQGG